MTKAFSYAFKSTPMMTGAGIGAVSGGIYGGYSGQGIVSGMANGAMYGALGMGMMHHGGAGYRAGLKAYERGANTMSIARAAGAASGRRLYGEARRSAALIGRGLESNQGFARIQRAYRSRRSRATAASNTRRVPAPIDFGRFDPMGRTSPRMASILEARRVANRLGWRPSPIGSTWQRNRMARGLAYYGT